MRRRYINSEKGGSVILRGYILLKPDASRFVGSVLQAIELSDFEFEEARSVADWSAFGKALYAHYKSDPQFHKIVMRHVATMRAVHGNKALVLVVSADMPFEAFAQKLVELKCDLRKSLVTEGVHIVVDTSTRESDEPTEKILVGSESRSQPLSDLMPEYGKWKIAFLNRIHCPDPDINEYENDFKLIDTLAVLSREQFDNVIRFKSFEVCE